MSNLQYVTKDTLEQMKSELQRMKAIDRPAASRAIAIPQHKNPDPERGPEIIQR